MISLFETRKKKEKRSIGVISAFDPSNTNGILVDTIAIRNCGYSPVAAISAIDIYKSSGRENGDSFSRHEIPSRVFSTELNTIFDSPSIALKVGSMGSEAQIEILAEKLSTMESPIVLDPSFISKRGEARSSERLLNLIFNRLINTVSLFVVNHEEAQFLSRASVFEPNSMRNAAKTIYERFGVNVLITGGHLDRVSRDIYYDGSGCAEFGADRRPGLVYGTGAAYSSLITCSLASNSSVGDAIEQSKEILSKAITDADTVNGLSIVNFT